MENAEIDLLPGHTECGHDHSSHQCDGHAAGKHDQTTAHTVARQLRTDAGDHDKSAPENRLHHRQRIENIVPPLQLQHNAHVQKSVVDDHGQNAEAADLVKQIDSFCTLFHKNTSL